MKSCRSFVAVASTLTALCFGPGARAAPALPAGLTRYVHQAMALWKVPGLAVGIVQGGKVIVARGYGVRELGKTGRVDADTLFTIGSNTKAFTAAALGLLVAQGKLRWDDRIIKYVPEFRLASAYVTQEATLRDLLSHRSGYCDPSSMWYMADDTTQSIIERLRYQKPRYGFRAHFCYNNTMYLVAAQVIPRLSGMTWGRYVTEHLLMPLQMTHTVTSDAALKSASDVAAPHAEVGGKVRVIRRYWTHNMKVFAPVGAINSSVADLNRWLIMLLAAGSYDGRTIVPAAVLRAMETPQEPIQRDSDVGQLLRALTPKGRFFSYGLGFILEDYDGHKLIWHAGNIDGMSAALALLPAEHVGVVVLSNMNDNWAPEGVMFHVLQSYLGIAHEDVSRRMYVLTQKERTKAKTEARKLAATRVPGAKPPLPLAAYVGTYSDRFYGTARVSESDGHLVLKMGDPMFTGDLQAWHNETFRVRWRYRFYGKAYVTFGVGARGEPSELRFAQIRNHYERVARRGGAPR